MSAVSTADAFFTMHIIRKYPFLAILITIAIIFTFENCNKEIRPQLPEDLTSVKNEVLKNNDAFKSKAELMISLIQKGAQAHQLQQNFDELRILYKNMEWAVEYFLPTTARFLNGPALPEIEMEEHTVLQPEGLQVLEELLYPYSPENKDDIIRELKKIINKSGTVKTNFETITVNRSQVFDALRQEIFRISSLGISGFDTPVRGKHLPEISHTLLSVQNILKFLAKTESDNDLNNLNNEIAEAVLFVKKNHDANTFDYATFLSVHLNRIATSMLDFRNSQQIKPVEVTTALNRDASHFYSKNAFDVNAFVPGENFRFSTEKALLGKKLFNEKQLSRRNDRSCATCHNPEKAFTDGLPKSMSLANTFLDRNTPSLNYSAFQHGQFWDMRREDLEGQSSDVITNKEEMHGDLNEIIKKINADQEYLARFKKIYKTPKAEVWQLQNALASYIRSMPKFSSDFDEYMRGNRNALTEDQKQGFNIFVGKAKCATCHFIPLFNGTVPPRYSKTEQEILGIGEDGTHKKADSDPGRGKFHETVAFLQQSFKTPTLRNIEKTAPYMHNGGYRTLEEVMDFYNKGGGKGIGFKIENQTLPEDPLNLTPKETSQVIQFMKALTDK